MLNADRSTMFVYRTIERARSSEPMGV